MTETVQLPSPDDRAAMERLGQVALDICKPILKAYWQSGDNGAMENMPARMGKAVVEELLKVRREQTVVGIQAPRPTILRGKS